MKNTTTTHKAGTEGVVAVAVAFWWLWRGRGGVHRSLENHLVRQLVNLTGRFNYRFGVTQLILAAESAAGL